MILRIHSCISWWFVEQLCTSVLFIYFLLFQVIGTEKAVGTSNINMNNLEYSLSMFKAMKYLEVGGYAY